MPAKRERAVGHGKPPVHSQFKKGQSGNPGGVPGPAKTLKARLKQALEGALDNPFCDLDGLSSSALEDLARTLVRRAVCGDGTAPQTLLALIERLEPAEKPRRRRVAAGDDSSGMGGDGTGTDSLTQGESQGDFEDVGEREEKIEPKQEVGRKPEAGSGRMDASSGSASPESAPPPGRAGDEATWSPTEGWKWTKTPVANR